jgi:hypothetical protein
MVRNHYRREVLPSGPEPVIPPISTACALLTVLAMAQEPTVQRVEVRFVGAPPAQELVNASGVRHVEIVGSVLRCLVWGSFQPFLEALRGHEVLCLTSIQSEEGVER